MRGSSHRDAVAKRLRAGERGSFVTRRRSPPAALTARLMNVVTSLTAPRSTSCRVVTAASNRSTTLARPARPMPCLAPGSAARRISAAANASSSPGGTAPARSGRRARSPAPQRPAARRWEGLRPSPRGGHSRRRRSHRAARRCRRRGEDLLELPIARPHVFHARRPRAHAAPRFEGDEREAGPLLEIPLPDGARSRQPPFRSIEVHDEHDSRQATVAAETSNRGWDHDPERDHLNRAPGIP